MPNQAGTGRDSVGTAYPLTMASILLRRALARPNFANIKSLFPPGCPPLELVPRRFSCEL